MSTQTSKKFMAENIKKLLLLLLREFYSLKQNTLQQLKD